MEEASGREERTNSRKNGFEEAFTFEIQEHLGVLRTSNSGWRKEMNVVSWNGKPAKYDLRDWSEDHKKMSKGITLTREEARAVMGWIYKREKQDGNTDESRAAAEPAEASGDQAHEAAGQEDPAEGEAESSQE